jgi:hypothetical protein
MDLKVRNRGLFYSRNPTVSNVVDSLAGFIGCRSAIQVSKMLRRHAL